MATITLNEQSVQHESAASTAEVSLNPFSATVLGVQRLERTYGMSRPVGEGARRAVHRFGDALEKLAE
jgi:hypothetical protein